ncbi:hypothetical protein BBP40_000059 [Aspergillus hancockii]|nr:hypothetical protein BBP40_000059 [Aspergillus hancockii]
MSPVTVHCRWAVATSQFSAFLCAVRTVLINANISKGTASASVTDLAGGQSRYV